MRRIAGACSLMLVIAALASGCSSTSGSFSPTFQTPTTRDGGFEVTIPALWADPRKGVSGIEPAKVWATRQGSSNFDIDLNGIEAKGAGSQWIASSATAAALGTLISGLNPEVVDLNFTITGPIDGPSAGGILTVGVIAALLNVPLRTDVTMTGTISPDGSIGTISGTDLKLKAAAEAGYRTVLLPTANMVFIDRATQTSTSAVDFGKPLGLTVIPVADVQEAFAIFTDNPFANPTMAPYALTAALNDAAASSTIARLATVRDQAAATNLTKGAASVIEEDITGAQLALDADDIATAYALSVDATLTLARNTAETKTRSTIESDGVSAAKKMVLADIDATIASAQVAIEAALDEAMSMGYEQQMSVPSAMGWLVYSISSLHAIRTMLTKSNDPDFVVRSARALADQRVSIDDLFPDAMVVIRSMVNGTSATEVAKIRFLSAYTNFLVLAGKANENYLREVLLRGKDLQEASEQNDLGFMLPIVSQMSLEAAAIDKGQNPLRAEIEQIAYAMTYFIASTSLVSASQVFGMAEFGVGADPAAAKSLAGLTSAVDSGAKIVSDVAAILASQKVNMGYSVWSATWGEAAFRALSKQDRASAGGVLALNELWYDSVTVYMMQAGPDHAP